MAARLLNTGSRVQDHFQGIDVMLRLCLSALLVITGSLAFAVPTASAGTITIGTFVWSEVGDGFGPALTVTNSSGSAIPDTTLVAPADFTNLSIFLAFDSEAFEDGETLLDPLTNGATSPTVFVDQVDVLRYARLSLTFNSQDLSIFLCAAPAVAPAGYTCNGVLQVDAADPFLFGFDERTASALIDVQVNDPAVVPEPASLMLLGTGMALLGVRRRRSRARCAPSQSASSRQ